MAIQLGRKVKDKITGFTGTVTGRAEYLTGCNQVLVAPPLAADGNVRDSQWLDEQRLDYVGEDLITLNNGTSPGFDKAPPKR